jgi:hypothetical protein
MSTTVAETLKGKELVTRIWKYFVRRIVFPLAVLCPFSYFFLNISLFYSFFGALTSATKAKPFHAATLSTGSGRPSIQYTWICCRCRTSIRASSAEDLPPAHQEEVKRLIEITKEQNLVAQLEERAKEFPRTMIFFRWYGINMKTILDVPAFHQPWNYIQTIGVSVFNKKVSTSRHFGYLRASLRVLYNLNDMNDRSAYIEVGNQTSYWCENKLFIFDDTLLHYSANETNQTRYCLFVDMIRPTPFPGFMRVVISCVRLLTKSFKFVYYNNWKILER